MLWPPQGELAFVTAARMRVRRARRAARARWADHARRGVPHLARPSHDPRHPLHATVRFLPHVHGLRRWKAARTLRRCFVAGCERFGFRLVQFALMGNHLHLVAEADSRAALRRGMQGLSIRVARALNRQMGRTGKVLADRYHARALRTPAEVRAAMNYVLTNARHHRLADASAGPGGTDPFSSALYFDGWVPKVQAAVDARRAAAARASPDDDAAKSPKGDDAAKSPVAPARTWLCRAVWRLRGRLHPAERPASPPR